MCLIKKRRSAVTFATQNFSEQLLSKPYFYTKKKSNRRVFVNMTLAASANSLVNRFPYKDRFPYMFRITSFMEPCMGKLILNDFIGNNCPESRNGLLNCYFFKLTLGRFPDQSLLNQSFKHNSVHMPSLNLTPKFSFEPRFSMFIINCYYTKSKRL